MTEKGQGALVEPRPAGLDALLPRPLAQKLEVPEYVSFREEQPADGEGELSLTRAGLSDRLVQDRKEKIALLPEELARKRQDLVMKYSIRVKLIPCAALFMRTPAVRILCDLSVERQKRSVSLTYNPMTRALDPLVCEGCSRSITNVLFCSRRHLLCSCCEGKCRVCGC